MRTLLCAALVLLVLAKAHTQTPADDDYTWQPLDALLTHAAHDESNAARYYLGGTSGFVLFTSDDGTTWRSSNLRSGSGQVTGLVALGPDTVLAAHGLNPSAYYVSADGAAGWTETRVGIPNFTVRLDKVNSSTVLIGGTSSGVHALSRDGGQTLDTIQRPGQLFSAKDGTIVNVASFGTFGNIGAVARSTDLGRTWTVVSTAPKIIGTPRVLSNGVDLYFRDATHFAIKPRRVDAIYVTSDGGAIFTSVKTPVQEFTSVLYLSDTELVAYRSVEAYRSTDGGLTWARATAYDPPVASPSTDTYIYARPDGSQLITSGNEVYSRPNATSQLSLKRDRSPVVTKTDLAAPDGRTVYLNAFNDPPGPEGPFYSYVSRDSGLTWTALNSNYGFVRFVQSADTVYFVFGNSTYRSTDGGRTATLAISTLDERSPVQRIVRISPRILCAITMVSSYRSDDNGETWRRLTTTAGPSFDGGVRAVGTFADGTILLSHQSSATPQTSTYWVSRDTARTWRRLGNETSNLAHGLFAISPDGKVYRAAGTVSVDTGRTYTRAVPNAQAPNQATAVHVRSAEQIMISSNRESVRTVDGGATWRKFPFASVGLNVNANAYSPASDAVEYAAGFNIFRLYRGAWPVATARINGVSAVRDGHWRSKLVLYPNPVAVGGNISVDGLGATTSLQLYDASGRYLSTLAVKAGRVSLPAELAPGLYMLSARETGGSTRIVLY